MYCDTSTSALGSAVIVRTEYGLKPVVFYSHKFTDTECRYGTTEREMFGVIDSLRHFKHMLLGRKFVVLTDHKPLTMFFSKTRQLTGREARWQNELCSF